MPTNARIIDDEPAKGFKNEEGALICLMEVTQKMVYDQQQQKKPEDPPQDPPQEKCPSYCAAA